MINIRHKNDLITIDLRTKQIRYLTDFSEFGEILFHSLSNADVEGYNYLWKEDKKLFLKTLKEDLQEFLGKTISVKNCFEVV